MTAEQEQTLIKMYSAGMPYKYISYALDIPMSTLASTIRRKYKALQEQTQHARQELIQKYSEIFADRFGVSPTVGQVIFENLYDRFYNKKKHCTKNNVEFSLKFTDLEFPEFCPLLGIKLDYLSEKSKDDAYPTYDRIDNTKGYTPENTHIVSWRGNRLKSNSTWQELQILTQNLQKLL